MGKSKAVMVGDGPEKERLEEKAAKLGMDDRIVLPGIWPRTRLFDVTWPPTFSCVFFGTDSSPAR
jgi:hypothetical protein